MEIFALNSLWLLPIIMTFFTPLLSRTALIGVALLQGLLHIGAWAWLVLRWYGQVLRWNLPWFQMGGYTFHYALVLHPGNLWLLFLTIVIGYSALLYALTYIEEPAQFTVFMGLTLGFSQGLFLADDVMLFFVFYEASLIPAFLLIYGWGGAHRRSAAIQFALFTLSGSVFLLVGLLWGMKEMGSSLKEGWHIARLPLGAWWLMSIGLAVKLPLLPLHSWLGEAHVEADSAVSMVLAGLLLKLGGYGLLYWVWDGIPSAQAISLRIWGMLTLFYAVAVAAGQTDLKRMIAFTSIAHMAFVPLGAGSESSLGKWGAYHQLFTHGVVSAGLFAWIGLVEKSTSYRSLRQLSGFLQRSRGWTLPTLFLFASAIGVPGMSLFISEMLVIGGTASGAGWLWALVPASSLLLTGAYFLRALRELFTSENQSFPAPIIDTKWFILWLLIFISGIAGVYPGPWLEVWGYGRN
ncbi:MAG: hypothetical protein NZ580_07485 [Bacteroidia bacterium]|nr:hypothetical protein [Bacteroidia bacterium]MDW8235940.1 proton-conducting transporter membrane subunit [Bacteroidia bacterium]